MISLPVTSLRTEAKNVHEVQCKSSPTLIPTVPSREIPFSLTRLWGPTRGGITVTFVKEMSLPQSKFGYFEVKLSLCFN
jgi:hypothetical protein